VSPLSFLTALQLSVVNFSHKSSLLVEFHQNLTPSIWSESLSPNVLNCDDESFISPVGSNQSSESGRIRSDAKSLDPVQARQDLTSQDVDASENPGSVYP